MLGTFLSTSVMLTQDFSHKHVLTKDKGRGTARGPEMAWPASRRWGPLQGWLWSQDSSAPRAGWDGSQPRLDRSHVDSACRQGRARSPGSADLCEAAVMSVVFCFLGKWKHEELLLLESCLNIQEVIFLLWSYMHLCFPTPWLLMWISRTEKKVFL